MSIPPSSSSTAIKPEILFLYHAAASLSSALIPYFLHLPSLSLSGIHTYIHPDTLPSSSHSSSSLRAAIRRPSDEPRSRSRSKPNPNLPTFDESKAQLFRLRLSDSHLHSRLLFLTFRTSFILSSLSLSNLALHLLLLLHFKIRAPSAAATIFPSSLSFLALSYLLYSLLSLSFHPSSHTIPLPLPLPLLLISAPLFALFLSPHLFDFEIPAAAAVSAFLLALILFAPATRAARSFWLGTDQLRWNLSVVSCGALNRILLYVAVLLNIAAPLLWFKPVVALLGPSNKLEEYRISLLVASALAQLVAVRPNLQMYLNEAVLCWYQRLHSSRVPDLDYGRAKVFLHNHYICVALMHFFGPPLVVLILIGLSQMRGNLFAGFFLISGLAGYSDLVKELALFLAWWIMFVSGVFVVATLALYRCRVLLVS